MKSAWTLSLICFLTCLSARAELVVINYPSFQGRAILARQQFDAEQEMDARANMVCRMAGYARAQVKEKMLVSYKVNYQLGAFVSSGEYFVPESVTTDLQGVMGLDWWRLVHDHITPTPGGIASNRSPKFLRRGKVHDCAKASLCRGFDVRHFSGLEGNDLDWRHPFVNACMNWGQRLSKEPMVFTQITCETQAKYRPVEADMRAFHERTKNAFKVTAGEPVKLGLQFADPAAGCAPYARATAGDLRPARPFTCDFQPFDPILLKYRLNVFAPSFMNYIYLTGRYVTGPRPEAVRTVLDRYTRTVIPEEYNLSEEQLAAMKRPFCVDAVSAVRLVEADGDRQCAFDVQTRDFLQAKNTIRIAFGSEDSEGADASRCETLARQFQHEQLSCQNAHFCPTPGMIDRGTNP